LYWDDNWRNFASVINKKDYNYEKEFIIYSDDGIDDSADDSLFVSLT
jgi:hypothetical protein